MTIGRLGAALTIAAVVAGCAPQQNREQRATRTEQPAALSATLRAEVAAAETLGRALHDSYRANAAVSEPAVKTAIETAQASVRDDCAPAYRTIEVHAPGLPADRIRLYHIGEIPSGQGTMLGRHYRIETSRDGKAVLLGEPSTAACLTLPPAADADQQAFVNHAMSASPDEFHVFISLNYDRTLLVTTEAGSWRVENGSITYLGRT